MSDLPRFTGSLRAFAGITNTKSEDPYTQQRYREELKWKKKTKTSLTTWSWSEVENLVDKSSDPVKVYRDLIFYFSMLEICLAKIFNYVQVQDPQLYTRLP